MTREDALDLGYCQYCAGYFKGRGWNCGIVLPIGHPDKNKNCIMPADAQERFRAERGLEGATKRYVRPVFGDKLPGKTRKKRRSFR
jgi:hypothetical protein